VDPESKKNLDNAVAIARLRRRLREVKKNYKK